MGANLPYQSVATQAEAAARRAPGGGMKEKIDAYLLKELNRELCDLEPPCLVYYDYGADIVDIIAEFNCHTQVVRRHSPLDPCYVNATFVSRKIR